MLSTNAKESQDYLLVKEQNAEATSTALREAGHAVLGQPPPPQSSPTQ